MKRFLTRTVLGYGLLILLLTAGAAQGLSGSDTIYSDDIVDGQVKGADIGNGTITAANLATGSVTSGKVLDNSLTGTDVVEKSLNMRGNCNSPGLIQGNVILLGHYGAQIPDTYQGNYMAFPYNCSGSPIVFGRGNVGLYSVRFKNNLHRGAVVSVFFGNSIGNSYAGVTAAVRDTGPGEFEISTTGSSGPVDIDVELIVW